MWKCFYEFCSAWLMTTRLGVELGESDRDSGLGMLRKHTEAERPKPKTEKRSSGNDQPRLEVKHQIADKSQPECGFKARWSPGE